MATTPSEASDMTETGPDFAVHEHLALGGTVRLIARSLEASHEDQHQTPTIARIGDFGGHNVRERAVVGEWPGHPHLGLAD